MRELSYVVNVIEKNNWHWVSAETKDLLIKYVNFNGSNRTYRADFFVNNKTLIECKPIKLHSSPVVMLKKKAAEEFCKNNGYEYLIVDEPILDKQCLISLYKNKQIKLLSTYEERFKKYLNITES